MAEASKKSVIQKLGLKPNHRAVMVDVPKGVELGKPPTGTKLSSKKISGDGECDFVLSFYESMKDLKADLPRIKKALAKTGMAWTGYRKGGATDISRDNLRELAEQFGLETVSLISVDDSWSAMKLMHPKKERK